MAYGLFRLSSYGKTNKFFVMVLSFLKSIVFLWHCQLFFSLFGFFSSSVQISWFATIKNMVTAIKTAPPLIEHATLDSALVVVSPSKKFSVVP